MTPSSASISESSVSSGLERSFVRCAPSLPSDVIAQVCREVFDSTPDQYDLSLTRVVPSQWCAEQRFRKGLSLVSRIWWEPATRALYEHIVIRHVPQIAALARTLRAEDAGFNFSALVRRITLHECVVVLPDCNIVGEDVRTIFERCVALEELSLHRHPDGVDAVVDSDDRVRPPEACINPIWIFPQIIVPVLQARAPTTLRKLDLVSFECSPDRNPSLTLALYNLISASPYLTSLAVQNLEAPGPELPSLPYLEDFSLYLPYLVPFPLTRDIWKWNLPNLRSLTFLDSFLLPVPVLESLGRALVYLHIYNTVYCDDRVLAQLPALCPALEHLVLHPAEPLPEWHPALIAALEAADTPAQQQQFARLRFLDVWITRTADAQLWTAERAAALRSRARASFAPALEGVRALLACMPGLPPDLPRMCRPSAVALAPAGEDGGRLVCVRDVWVVQTAWCVRPVADWWLDEDMWMEDESGDYVYESESDEDEDEDWDSEPLDELDGDDRDVGVGLGAGGP